MRTCNLRSVICIPSFPCMKIVNGSFLDASTEGVPAVWWSVSGHGLTGVGGVGGVGGVHLERL